ncbi:MAG TPA: cobalamin-dependent protein [Steroidobacteraceae bacterium]|nr:cobalamin-dependent protein [Steroidobacteraceae bacterium]
MPANPILNALRDQYLNTQLAGDRRAALRFIDDALRSGVSVPDMQTHVVRAAQHEIGKLWQEDRISVAQEHLATAISHLALAHLFQHAEFRARVGRKVVVACVPGELHDLPARLLSDALDVHGYDVRFLGADVPLQDLLAVLAAEKPALLALSVTMLFNLPSMREVLRQVRSALPGLPIAIGGHAATTPDAVPFDAPDVITGSAEQLLNDIDRLLAARA